MTEILEGPEAIVDAVARLGLGEPVAFPTETVYGLGADALDPDAVERVFSLKGRPSSNPLIVHVSGPEMAAELVDSWPPMAQALADRFWPGSLTMVLPKADHVPSIVTAEGPTVAVRCPAHPIALALIESLGKPLVGPSANPSGWISPTTPEHVSRGFEGSDLLIIDGGPCRAGIESTVIDLSHPDQNPTILRPGIITKHQLESVLETRVDVLELTDTQPSDDESTVPAASPGLIGAHYQPKSPTTLVDSETINDADSTVYVISWSLESSENAGGFFRIPRDPGGFARELYNAMHEGDASSANRIWIERPPYSTDSDGQTDDPDSPDWVGIMERLRRACR